MDERRKRRGRLQYQPEPSKRSFSSKWCMRGTGDKPSSERAAERCAPRSHVPTARAEQLGRGPSTVARTDERTSCCAAAQQCAWQPHSLEQRARSVRVSDGACCAAASAVNMRDLGFHDMLMLALSTRVCSVLLASTSAASNSAASRLATQPRRGDEGGDAEHAACRERRAFAACERLQRACARGELRQLASVAANGRTTRYGTVARRSRHSRASLTQCRVPLDAVWDGRALLAWMHDAAFRCIYV